MIFRHFLSTLCRAALLALVINGLAGCVHYQERPLAPEKTAAALAARSLNDNGLHRFLAQNLGRDFEVWPPAAWDFDLLALAAYYYQPSLDIARAEWSVATAGKVTAGERPNPSVSLSGTYDTTTPPPWIPGVTFDIPIETAGKRGYRVAQAQDPALIAFDQLLHQPPARKQPLAG